MHKISVINTEIETAHLQYATVSVPVEGRLLNIYVNEQRIRGVVQDVEQHVTITDGEPSELHVVYLADIKDWPL